MVVVEKVVVVAVALVLVVVVVNGLNEFSYLIITIIFIATTAIEEKLNASLSKCKLSL